MLCMALDCLTVRQEMQSTLAELDVQPLDEENTRLLDAVHPAGHSNPVSDSVYNLVVLGAGAGGLVSTAIAACKRRPPTLAQRKAVSFPWPCGQQAGTFSAFSEILCCHISLLSLTSPLRVCFLPPWHALFSFLYFPLTIGDYGWF